MSLAPSTASTNKTPRILACVLCQHRKIKCDRSFPCANCLKANVQCTPSTPAPARKRRRPNQDLQERLARCEELLREYSTEGKAPDDGNSTSPSKSPDALPSYENSPVIKTEPRSVSAAAEPWKPRGKLVNEDGTVRFIDSYLIVTIHDELKAMREIIDNDDTSPEDDTSESLTPDTNGDLLLGGETPQTTAPTTDLQPSPAHVFRLWQIFLDRVNPLIKIIHVPTMQPYLVEAASGSQNLPRNIEALLFSIYTLAVVALAEDECQGMLGCTRDAALQRFSAGVRTSLLRIGFLKTHDITTLQALVLYLISLQGRYNRHAAWILNGVVIRIAQKMGLHRDGEVLGLSPFETEMRRRLWWQIMSLDAKYGIFSGLGHSLLPRGWDAKEPKNVNDADLHPSATEPIQDRDGPTEMIMVLLTNRVSRFLAEMPVLEPIFLFSWFDATKVPGGPTPEQLVEFRGLLDELVRSLLDLLDRWCDPAAGPLHEYAVDFKSLILQKLQDFFNPSVDEVLEASGTNRPTQNDHLFQLGVNAIEQAGKNYVRASRNGFLWFSRLQFQLDVPVFVANQLCSRASGKLVERAWSAMEGILQFHPELTQIGTGNTKESLLLATCLARAWRVRENHLLQQTGVLPPTPDFIQRIRNSLPPEYLKDETPMLSNSQLPNHNHVLSNGANHSGGGAGGPGVNVIPADLLKHEPINPTASLDPTFDDFMGNYLETDWDMFAMNLPTTTSVHDPIVPVTVTGAAAATTGGASAGAPGNPVPPGHLTQVSDPNHNPMPTTFGAFGVGPSTEW